MILFSCSDKSIKIWSPIIIGLFQRHTNTVHIILLSKDNSYLVSGSSDKLRVHGVCELVKNALLRKATPLKFSVLALVMTTSGLLLGRRSDYMCLKFYKQALQYRLNRHSHWVRAVFLPAISYSQEQKMKKLLNETL
jgi:WD40 repeat protein